MICDVIVEKLLKPTLLKNNFDSALFRNGPVNRGSISGRQKDSKNGAWCRFSYHSDL